MLLVILIEGGCAGRRDVHLLVALLRGRHLGICRRDVILDEAVRELLTLFVGIEGADDVLATTENDCLALEATHREECIR